MKGESVSASMEKKEKKIEYITLDENRVLVIAYRPGEKPIKTIVEVGPPELEEEEYASEPQPR